MSESSTTPMFQDDILGPRRAPDLLEEDEEALYRAVRAGGMTFAIPDSAVVEWRTLEGKEVGRTLRGDGAPRVQVGDASVRLFALETSLPSWLERPCAPPVVDYVEVLVLQVGDAVAAVSVDQVDDPIQLDFEPPAGAREGAVLGAKMTEDGVVFVLDAAELVRSGSRP